VYGGGGAAKSGEAKQFPRYTRLTYSLPYSLTRLLIYLYPAENAHTRAASRAHWEVDNMKKVTHTDKQTRNKTHTKNNQKAGNPGRARRKSSRQVRRTKQAGEKDETGR